MGQRGGFSVVKYKDNREELIVFRGVGFGQGKIAEKLGISQQTVSNWLSRINDQYSGGDIEVNIRVDKND